MILSSVCDCFLFFQSVTGDEYLDELLSNDASLDDGAIPDIKVMDSGINMSGNEVRKGMPSPNKVFLEVS